MGKTIAERLREADETACTASDIAYALGWEDVGCGKGRDCLECTAVAMGKLADAIEAEQRAAVSKALLEEVGKPDSVSVGLLVDVAGELEDAASMLEGAMSEDLSHWAVLIRKAVKSPAPEVLDADGVPIKVGDIVWYEDKAWRVSDVYGWSDGEGGVNLESFIKDEYDEPVKAIENAWNKLITHRKPDTQEAIDSDAELFAVTLDADDEERFRSLLERQRKLLGGE